MTRHGRPGRPIRFGSRAHLAVASSWLITRSITLVEERSTPIVSRVAHPRRAGEQPARHMLDVLVQRVLLGQGQLYGHELLAWIPLVGDEEQPRVQPAEPV